jgi:hypothetical protein
MKITLTVPTTTTSEVEITEKFYKNANSDMFFKIHDDGTVTYIKNYEFPELKIYAAIEVQSINLFASVYYKDLQPCTEEDWIKGLESAMDLLKVV